MNNEINNAAQEAAVKSKRKNLRTLRRGTYIVVVSAIVIAVVIAVNLFVSVLPASFRNIDMTDNSMYTLSDETKTILSAVNSDINMYIIAEAQKENSTTDEVRNMLERYAELNSHIKVSTVDPGVSPNFTSQYTTDKVSTNSVIVVSDKRSRVVDPSKLYMYVTDYGNFTQDDYAYYQNMGMSLGGTLNYFGEMYFTGAISYVSDENIPTVYLLTGHGEQELDSESVEAVTGENISTESLNLLTASVSESAAAVIINQPTYDISESEYNSLDAYLNGGGNIILITDAVNYSTVKMPYISKIAEKMGLKSIDGIVIETAANGYSQYPYNVVPTIGTGGPAALLRDSGTAIMLYGGSHGIVSAEGSSASVYPLLSTSSSSYVKSAGVALTTFEKEDGDTDGPVYLGAASTLALSDNVEAKFTWYTSPNIMTSSMAKGNLELFCATLNWMCDKETSISIIGREISASMLTVTSGSATLWSNMIIVVIPLSVLIIGFVIWWRRRRK